MADVLPEFKNKFDITTYGHEGKDILPYLHGKNGYLQHDEILNYKDHEKGNLEKCIWQRHIPTRAEIESPTWRAIESKRILKTGVWPEEPDEKRILPADDEDDRFKKSA